MAETKATTKSVTVFGPNLHSRSGAFHVHATGCADTGKALYRGHVGSTIEVTCLRAVVQDIYADFDVDDESWQDYAADLRVFPCVKLPDELAETVEGDITCENCGEVIEKRMGEWVHPGGELRRADTPRCWPGRDFFAVPDMDA